MRFEAGGKRVFAGTGSAIPVADAPTVIFVHGAGMDHTVWVLPSRYFARQGFSVLAVDLPGHGRSEGPPLTRIEDMSDWLAEVCEACGVTTAAIAGHSMGSLVAYRFVADHPQRCRALALLGTSMPMPVTGPLLDAAQDNHHAAIEMANAWSHSPAASVGGNRNPGVWLLAAGERLLERAAPGVFHADLTACNAFDLKAVGAPPPVPTLVVAGEADRMTPLRAGVDVARALPNARVVTLPGCGHAMLGERPNEVLDALIETLSA